MFHKHMNFCYKSQKSPFLRHFQFNTSTIIAITYEFSQACQVSPHLHLLHKGALNKSFTHLHFPTVALIHRFHLGQHNPYTGTLNGVVPIETGNGGKRSGRDLTLSIHWKMTNFEAKRALHQTFTFTLTFRSSNISIHKSLIYHIYL